MLANHGDLFRNIRSSTAGIIFLGAPHQGSDAAVYGLWLSQALGHDKTLLESLKRNSSSLYEIAQDFESSYRGVDVVCFYENKEASYGPWRTQVCLFWLQLDGLKAYDGNSSWISSRPLCPGKE